MKGMARSTVMRWMASAMVRTWASDSMTQGPAMRKSWPAPTCTGPISKELLTKAILPCSGEPGRKLRCASRRVTEDAINMVHFLYAHDLGHPGHQISPVEDQSGARGDVRPADCSALHR